MMITEKFSKMRMGVITVPYPVPSDESRKEAIKLIITSMVNKIRSAILCHPSQFEKFDITLFL